MATTTLRAGRWFVERATASLYDDEDIDGDYVGRAVAQLDAESVAAIDRVLKGTAPALFFHVGGGAAGERRALVAATEVQREWDGRYAYFVRTRDDAVPAGVEEETAADKAATLDDAMSSRFDFGCAVGGSLHTLGDVLGLVYSPLLASP
jgi:hypothetical protein